MFDIVDVIIVLIIAGFAFSGFWLGLIHMIGSLIGVGASFYISANYFDLIFARLAPHFEGKENFGKVITYMAIFVVVSRLTGFIFSFITKLLNVVSIIPFFKTINRLAGLVLGGIEGIAILSFGLFAFIRYPFGGELINELADSVAVGYLLDIANKFAPYIPELYEQTKGLIS